MNLQEISKSVESNYNNTGTVEPAIQHLDDAKQTEPQAVVHGVLDIDKPKSLTYDIEIEVQDEDTLETTKKVVTNRRLTERKCSQIILYFLSVAEQYKCVKDLLVGDSNKLDPVKSIELEIVLGTAITSIAKEFYGHDATNWTPISFQIFFDAVMRSEHNIIQRIREKYSFLASPQA